MTEINEIQNWLKSDKRNFVLSLIEVKVNEIQQNWMKLKCYRLLCCEILLDFVKFCEILFNSVKAQNIYAKYC